MRLKILNSNDPFYQCRHRLPRDAQRNPIAAVEDGTIPPQLRPMTFHKFTPQIDSHLNQRGLPVWIENRMRYNKNICIAVLRQLNVFEYVQ